MKETCPLIASVDFVLYSPMGGIGAPQVDLAKMAVDRQMQPDDDPLDQDVWSCQLQRAISTKFFCVKTSHRQTRTPRSAT